MLLLSNPKRINSAQDDRLVGVSVKHNKNLSNLSPLDLEEIAHLDLLASSSLSRTICQLIIDLRVDYKETFSATINARWRGILETWV